MASALREQDPPLALAEIRDRLFAEPQSFDFFQAVRLLEILQTQRAPVGDFAHPRNEAVRFRVPASLIFPASAIQQLELNKAGDPEMTVNFMGLIGPLGLLPSHYTELAMERAWNRDKTLADFLNIFQHRAISLFFRAWEKCHFTVGYERDKTDPVTQRLLDFVGLGLPSLQQRQSVRDESIIFYGGLLALAPRSAAVLESILSDYFSVPVQVDQFIGLWRPLTLTDQCCLDAGSMESTELGWGAVAGDEIWDRSSRARVRIGPLTADVYREFLPEGPRYEPLRALTRFYAGNNTEFEVELILRREEVPRCELTDDSGPAQLGWFTWMKSSDSFDRDPHDTILLFPGD